MELRPGEVDSVSDDKQILSICGLKMYRFVSVAY
jgi:hypothetical protein